MTHRRTRVPLSTLLMLATVSCTGSLSAQAAPLVIEVRAGASKPLASLASGSGPGEGTETGASFGLDLVVPGEGRRALFVGFSQHRFGCDAAGCARGGQYVATGFDLGFRWDLRTRGSVIPWIRLGAVTTRVEVPDLPAPDTGVSKLGIGGEVGLGVYIGASSPVALNPGIRFSAVNTELPGGGLLRMRYLVADFAITLAF